MAKHRTPAELVDRWLDAAIGDKQVMRELLTCVRSTRQGRLDLIGATEHLGGSTVL